MGVVSFALEFVMTCCGLGLPEAVRLEARAQRHSLVLVLVPAAQVFFLQDSDIRRLVVVSQVLGAYLKFTEHI